MGSDRDKNNMSAFIPCRKRREFIPENKKDEGYWEKRRKNNEAARRSREKRRYSDIALETRIVNMSRDNKRLRIELTAIKKRFGIPPNETFIPDDDDLPRFAHGYQPLRSSVSPPGILTQHAGPIALLGQVEQNAERARSVSGSVALSVQDNCPGIALPSLESYSITNVQIPPFHTSILPIDYSRRNTPVRSETESRCYPVKVEPLFYQQSKHCCEEDEPIPMPRRNDLTERTAYSYNISRSIVPQYNFSLSRTGTSPSTASLSSTCTCSSNGCDRRDEIEEAALPYKDER